jgi:ankyrin repeat protein
VFENDHGPTSFRETQGFDPAKCSQEGIGSLQLAAYFAKTTDTLKVILETGAFDVNRVDENGDTALFYALAGYNSPGNVCHLIEKGADPDIANRKNVTPMNVVGTEKMKELEDIMKETRQIYLNSVAPSPIRQREMRRTILLATTTNQILLSLVRHAPSANKDHPRGFSLV